MLEGLAILVAIYGLTILLPAISNYQKMREINKNCQSVPGTVVRASSSVNMLAGPLGGTAYRTSIHYRPPTSQESFEIYMRDHNLLMTRKYSAGDTVEVIYNVDAPHLAYPKLEWRIILQDFRGAAICFVVAILLVVFASIIK